MFNIQPQLLNMYKTGGIFAYFDNEKLGAWWVGMMCVICGILALISTSRGWVIATCVVSFASVIISIVGAAEDGTNAVRYRKYEACATSDGQGLIDYGNRAYYNAANNCLLAANPSITNNNNCYCVARKNNAACIPSLQLSADSIRVSQTCGNVLTTYTQALAASTFFCVVIFIFLLAMSIFSLVTLTCAQRVQEVIIITRGPPKDVEQHDVDIGVINEGDPAKQF